MMMMMMMMMMLRVLLLLVMVMIMYGCFVGANASNVMIWALIITEQLLL